MSIRSFFEAAYTCNSPENKLCEIIDACLYEANRAAHKEFPTDEAEYIEGKAALERILNDGQKMILSEIEKSWHNNVKFAVDFGFFKGNCVKRRKASTANMESLFDELIVKEVLTVPGMLKYPEYYAERKCNLRLSEVLEKQLDEEGKEHLISINCAWDQKLYSVLRDAFRRGISIAKNR